MSVHRPSSMQWLALLVYVVLVLRLSNVVDLRLLPLTPLLRFPLVEVVEEQLEAMCGGQSPGPSRPWCSMPLFTSVVEDVCLGPTFCRSRRPSGFCSGSVLADFSGGLRCFSSLGSQTRQTLRMLEHMGPFPCGTSLRDHVPEQVWDHSESVSAQSGLLFCRCRG